LPWTCRSKPKAVEDPDGHPAIHREARRSGYRSPHGCAGYFPPPPHNRLGFVAEQDLMIVRGFAPIAPVRGSLWFQLAATASRLATRAMRALRTACRPSGVAGGVVTDLTRSRAELIVENAFLRQQLIVASRSVKRGRFRGHERGVPVLLARLLPRWRSALLMVKPQTVLRWHRAAFRLLWRRKSRSAGSREPRMAPDVIALIQRMAIENRLWGAERIRGELLKLGIHVAKRTVQRYMRGARPPSPRRGQSWAIFLRNHTVWACDFLQTYEIWFRPVFAFFIIDVNSRRVVHVAVTRTPTRQWTAQQLRKCDALRTGAQASHPRPGTTRSVPCLTMSPRAPERASCALRFRRRL
jgi:hypothetical protein